MPGPYDPNRIGINGPPAIHPGFVDARPVVQVAANPMPGYDYSKRPDGQAIQDQIKARQQAQPQPPKPVDPTAATPAATGGVGVTGPSPAPSGNVGLSPVPNAYAMPPNPEMQHWNADQARMMHETQSTMGALLNGSHGRYGQLAPQERASAYHALSDQVNTMTGAGTQGRIGEMQFGNDPKHNPEMIAAQIAALKAEATNHLAQANAADPMKRLDMVKQIGQDPTMRALYLADVHADPAVMAQMPPIVPGVNAPKPGVNGMAPAGGAVGVSDQPAVHAGNMRQVLALPQNQSLAQIIDDPNKPFDQKFLGAAQIPDFRDPNSPTRQAFNAWVHQQYPSRDAYQDMIEGYPAVGPDEWEAPWGGHVPGMEWLGGPMMALSGSLMGRPTGTGFGWRGNHKAGQNLFQAMSDTGYSY